jgi:hypothetical protein
MGAATQDKQAKIESLISQMVIDGDDRGTFAKLPSSSPSIDHYEIPINESGPCPVAVRCQCSYYYYRSTACTHMQAVDLYYQRFVARSPKAPVVEKKVSQRETVVLPNGNAIQRVIRNQRTHNGTLFGEATISNHVTDVRMTRTGEWEVVSAALVIEAIAADTRAEKLAAVREAERIANRKKRETACLGKRRSSYQVPSNASETERKLAACGLMRGSR